MPFNPNPSVLAALPEEQQQQILAWLDVHRVPEVVKMIAAPPPEGLGLQTHPNSVKRFYARHRAASIKDSSELAAEILSADPKTADIDSAVASTLRQLALELANSPRLGVKHFKALSRWILKLRDQDHQARALTLAQERLALDHQKWQFNAARQALLKLPELTKIMNNPATDDEDKIWAARDKLFGSSPAPERPSPRITVDPSAKPK
jgi:hypothetical protein